MYAATVVVTDGLVESVAAYLLMFYMTLAVMGYMKGRGAYTPFDELTFFMALAWPMTVVGLLSYGATALTVKAVKWFARCKKLRMLRKVLYWATIPFRPYSLGIEIGELFNRKRKKTRDPWKE